MNLLLGIFPSSYVPKTWKPKKKKKSRAQSLKSLLKMLKLLQLSPPVFSLSLAILISSGLACHANAFNFLAQEFIAADPAPPAAAVPCQQPFTPTPQHPVPGRKRLFINETTNFHERYVNGSGGGEYRRLSCPAVNTLANRGFINRSGRDITADELIKAFIEVFNFGIDNVGASRSEG